MSHIEVDVVYAESFEPPIIIVPCCGMLSRLLQHSLSVGSIIRQISGFRPADRTGIQLIIHQRLQVEHREHRADVQIVLRSSQDKGLP